MATLVVGTMLKPYDIRKKEIEKRALDAARHISSVIPGGEAQDFEEPDFKIQTASGLLGVEVTELLPPASSDSFSSPVAEQRRHEDVVQLAEKEYYRTPGAIPVRVHVYFWSVDGTNHNKIDMARALAEFVRSHRGQATPVATFSWRPNLPEGFGVISIASESGPWTNGESVGVTVSEIEEQLGARIAAKNERLPTYRSNLPNSPIWLLLYSGAEVARGVPMPHGISEWTFPFAFDRIFFFSSLDNKVEEIRRKGDFPALRSICIR